MVSMIQLRTFLLGAIFIFWLSGPLTLTASAGTLQSRLAQFPNWRSPPILQPAKGDLYYPDWMAGNWQVTSTLTDLAAPLAPAVITPGFETSQKLLEQPVTFSVRFEPAIAALPPRSPFPVGTVRTDSPKIVADRAYNGMSLATALLGQDVVQSIEVDPRSPNRQLARFKSGQRLVTQISDRGVETPSNTEFISSELYQQIFRSETQLYLNQVENTIAYRWISTEPEHIEADQVTAIYLSPQDPDYFKAKAQPVTLYRYRLRFERAH
jgi:hypothetical protein